MFGSYGIHKLDVLSVWYNLARNLRFLLYFSVEVLLIEIYSPKKKIKKKDLNNETYFIVYSVHLQ